MTEPHENYMQQCLLLARQAQARGNTAVGSILVKEGAIIGSGIEGQGSLPPLLAHAEALAILEGMERLGAKDLSECTLYTTVEPCFLCSYLIRQSKISCVVYGTVAGSIGGAESAYPILAATDIAPWSTAPKLLGGVLAQECSALLRQPKASR